MARLRTGRLRGFLVLSTVPSPTLPRLQIAAVVVGFPATPLVLSRVRFCISAGHSRADLDYALGKIDEVCGVLKLRYRRSSYG